MIMTMMLMMMMMTMMMMMMIDVIRYPAKLKKKIRSGETGVHDSWLTFLTISRLKAIFLFVCLLVCLFIRLSSCLSACPPVYSPVLLFIRLSSCLSVCPPVYPSVLLFIRLSSCLSVCPPVYSSGCPSSSLLFSKCLFSLCLSIHPSIHPSIRYTRKAHEIIIFQLTLSTIAFRHLGTRVLHGRSPRALSDRYHVPWFVLLPHSLALFPLAFSTLLSTDTNGQRLPYSIVLSIESARVSAAQLVLPRV